MNIGKQRRVIVVEPLRLDDPSLPEIEPAGEHPGTLELPTVPSELGAPARPAPSRAGAAAEQAGGTTTS